ncbi:MAG: hypothetical protein EOO56_20965 [Hymenobacter sp.]|nr:MAG: hypothetical protein EOO56_20965 [Hymenobacter sp.]
MADNQNKQLDGAADSGTIPALVRGEYGWEGTVALPQWLAFNRGYGTWKAIRAATNARRRKREKRAGQERFQYPDSDGAIQLSVTSSKEDLHLPPRPEQVRAYRLLLMHEAELLAATLATFKKHWAEICCIYDHDDDDPNRHSLPLNLRAPEELCGLIALHHIYIGHKHTDGVAHVGLALSCDWDTEHGLGVYSCHGEVLGIGSGDLAFNGLSSAFKFWKKLKKAEITND